MSRSTASSRERSACTSSRASTSCSASAGTSPDDDAAPLNSSDKRRFVCAASRPPFRMAALPDFKHSEAICTSASGRDSNTAAMTPKGHVMRLSVNSSSSSVAMRATPSGSGRAATARTPSAICAILPPVSSRRLSSGSDISPLATSGSASATSFSFASRIRRAFSLIASATAAKARFRTSSLKGASASAALLAARHMESISLKVNLPHQIYQTGCGL